jgi:YVTN family beta-propeller protein
MVILAFLCAALTAQNPTEPLEAVGKIALSSVHGRIDHLAADFYHGRLFIAALGNDSVEVIDVRNNASLASITGVVEPQGVAYSKSPNRLFVTNGGDGTLRIFNGTTLKPLNSLHLGQDADNIRLDAAHKRLYVGYGDGAIAVLDLTGKQLADIPLKAHPESFQLAEKAPRLYVNVPAAHSIGVVNTNTLKVIAEWPIKEGQDNFPMALDEANRRIFVGCRRPSRLLVLDMDSGIVLTQLVTVGDADDLFYDPIHARIYVIGGQGQIAIYAQQTPDRYVAMDSVGTVAGARTGLFVPEWNRLFVAVRQFAAHPAEIRVYQPR